MLPQFSRTEISVPSPIDGKKIDDLLVSATADDAPLPIGLPDDECERLVLRVGIEARVGAGAFGTSLPPLSQTERRRRIAALFALWASGCRRAIDERLFQDLAVRRPADLAALRRALGRRRAE